MFLSNQLKVFLSNQIEEFVTIEKIRMFFEGQKREHAGFHPKLECYQGRAMLLCFQGETLVAMVRRATIWAPRAPAPLRLRFLGELGGLIEAMRTLRFS